MQDGKGNMARKRPSRVDKLTDRAIKKLNPSPEKPVTPAQAEAFLDEYDKGRAQHLGGELKAKVITSFLGRFPEANRQSFEVALNALHRVPNFSRFRTKAMVLLMTVYQNGLVDGKAGKTFDIEQEIMKFSKEIQAAEIARSS